MRVVIFWFARTAVATFVRQFAAGGVAPLPARIIGGISLFIWISVLVAGRMEAFFESIRIP